MAGGQVCMFERFTDQARRSVVLAQEEARLLGQNYIGGEHVLLGLIAVEDGSASRALHESGVTLERARSATEAEADRAGRPRGQEVGGHIPFTPRSKKVLELALREALQRRHNAISSGHILLALLAADDPAVVSLLSALGIDHAQVRGTLEPLLPSEVGQVPTGSAGVAGDEGRLARLEATLAEVLERLARIERRLDLPPEGASDGPRDASAQ